jgi:hypothetical protein
MGKKRKNRMRPDAERLAQPRTRRERAEEQSKIVTELTALGLRMTHQGVPELMRALHEYVEKGERAELNIGIPDASRHLVGVLATSRREQVWIKLVKDPS